MALKVLEVLPTSEARDQLSETLHRFEAEGESAAPMLFGRHRRAEAAVIPFKLYEQLMSLLDDAAIVEEISTRIAKGEDEIGWAEGVAKLGIDPNSFE